MITSQVTTIQFIYKHAHLRVITNNDHSFHSTHRAYNYLFVSKVVANQCTPFHPSTVSYAFILNSLTSPVPSHDTTISRSRGNFGKRRPFFFTLPLTTNPSHPPNSCLFEVYQIPLPHRTCDPLSLGRVLGFSCHLVQPCLHGFLLLLPSQHFLSYRSFS